MAAATISEERWFYDAEEVSSFFEIEYFTLLPLATITLTITITLRILEESGKMKGENQLQLVLYWKFFP